MERLRGAVSAGMRAHGHDLSAWDGEIDVVFGGPPCQGFSTMGKRDIRDRRNRLVYRFADVVRELQPRYFVMENVPGMAAGDHGGILKRLIKRFENSGYRITPVADLSDRILNAKDFGVPQDRRRLFILGARQDQKSVIKYPAATVRPISKRTPVSYLFHGEQLPVGPSVWDAIGDLAGLESYADLFEHDELILPDAAIFFMHSTASDYVRRLRMLDEDSNDFSYRRRWNRRLLTASMRTKHSNNSARRFEQTPGGATERVSRFYKLDKFGLSNTLRAGTGNERGSHTSPRPIHPTEPRVISVREAARLHSFPDWFRFHRTKWHGFRSIGNSVPPLLARAVAAQVMVALECTPRRPCRELSLGDVDLLDVGRLAAAARMGANEKHIPPSRTRNIERLTA